ncbi:DUF5753 domain-containing protein [Nocardia sp. NPDC019219]|uniref:DUF5753 domain-containing protein n=1 Tax=Nocardia sp. NPDC019219 TaxID=3154590 RepID=UPI0034049BF5
MNRSRLTGFAEPRKPDPVTALGARPDFSRLGRRTAGCRRRAVRVPRVRRSGLRHRSDRRSPSLRRRSQNIVTRRTQPVTLDVVIGEASLRRVAGSHAVMATQNRYLADVSTRDNVTIRVLPFDAGFPGGVSMPPFVILSFGDSGPVDQIEPPVVYLEGAVGDMYLEDADDVRFYTQRYDRIREAALDVNSSRTLLRQVAREHEQRGR